LQEAAGRSGLLWIKDGITESDSSNERLFLTFRSLMALSYVAGIMAVWPLCWVEN
jgi:hypothetical protein